MTAPYGIHDLTDSQEAIIGMAAMILAGNQPLGCMDTTVNSTMNTENAQKAVAQAKTLFNVVKADADLKDMQQV